jgi:serine protease
MRVTSPDLQADAGQHYVLLVDADSEETIAFQIVNAVDGEYRFSVTDVPSGRYRLYAGTDLDNDEFICDGGEACGAYPSLASPGLLSIDPRQEPELSGRAFASEFRTTATTTATAEAEPPRRVLGRTP